MVLLYPTAPQLPGCIGTGNEYPYTEPTSDVSEGLQTKAIWSESTTPLTWLTPSGLLSISKAIHVWVPYRPPLAQSLTNGSKRIFTPLPKTQRAEWSLRYPVTPSLSILKSHGKVVLPLGQLVAFNRLLKNWTIGALVLSTSQSVMLAKSPFW